MAKKSIAPSKLRILMNAEPFGFGPTAAIASFFPHLAPHAERIGYMGEGHTLDLQKNLKYTDILDITGSSPEEIKALLKQVKQKYDVFFTAVDFSMAELAREAGFKIGIFDPLTWFWKELPEVIQKSDLYLAQAFLGVQEVLNRKPSIAKHAFMVAPIVDKPVKRKEEHILVNLGGLQNPFWSKEETVQYAKAILESIRGLLGEERVIIATNKKIAEQLPSLGARCFDRKEMRELLLRAKFAIMTPGLGNIFDSAQYDLPTLWLPPANDSQGQQVKLLRDAGLIDVCLDWSEITGDTINYEELQPTVLKQIAQACVKLTTNAPLHANLHKQCQIGVEKIRTLKEGATSGLLNKFGFGGTKEVVRLILNHFESE